jgi:glycosyltransferase involved in cell wall biosynthesis
MTHVGIDIEQFVRDPYGSGIQRVLQYLAKEWPAGIAQADFVVPIEDQFGLLTPSQAAELLSIPFIPREPGSDLRFLVRDGLAALDPIRVKAGDLLAIYDSWMLPEVSYLPRVQERFELFAKCMPTVMIGYDTLPMSDPANYRFKPGRAAWVSEYFRHLASASVVVCISDYARDSILGRLRRDPALPITVAHPGGDHLEPRASKAPEPSQRPVFARLGTLEARKRPLEILRGFQEAVASHGVEAELLFIGGQSASDESINATVREASAAGGAVRWVQGASDEEVYDLVNRSTAFLSIGTEGYGIPVLEAIRLGTPVLFDGIQPAGDLMVGRGARRVPALDHDDVVRMFVDYQTGSALGELVREVAPERIPTWSDFATSVASACHFK